MTGRKEIRMDRNIPLPGTFYRHPDGNICQIICIAKNYADKDKEVVYQEMFPPFDIWTKLLKVLWKKLLVQMVA